MPRISDEEVWYWYELVHKYNSQNLPASQFCKLHQINYADFSIKVDRFNLYKFTNPDLQEKLIALGKEYKSEGGSRKDFYTKHNLSSSTMDRVITHLNYLETIERIIKEKKDGPIMNFIEVPVANKMQPIEEKKQFASSESMQEPELLEKRNDIEITIAKGIKVTIAPNIDSTKIIRIIDLLKDL